MSSEPLEPVRPNVPGYYGRPALKPPVWTWEVPAYLFVGGAAGASSLLGAVARHTGASPALVRDARLIGGIGSILSAPLLISDLGRPERFLNMLRVFKLQSPMSVGVWTLVVFSGAAGSAALADLLGRRANGRRAVRRLGDGAETVSAAAGLVLSTYTGVLIGATAIPIWARHVSLLPVQFGLSGLASAAALLELRGHRDRALHRIGIGTALGETAIALRLERAHDPQTHALHGTRPGMLLRAAGILGGPVPLLLRAVAGRSKTVRQLAAVSALAGSLLTRIAWVSAGKASARAPIGAQETASS